MVYSLDTSALGRRSTETCPHSCSDDGRLCRRTLRGLQPICRTRGGIYQIAVSRLAPSVGIASSDGRNGADKRGGKRACGAALAIQLLHSLQGSAAWSCVQHPALLAEEAGASWPICTGAIVPMEALLPHAGVLAALIDAAGVPVCELEDTAPLPQPAALTANNSAIEMNEERVM